jgi:hypothetical protein
MTLAIARPDRTAFGRAHCGGADLRLLGEIGLREHPDATDRIEPARMQPAQATSAKPIICRCELERAVPA